MADDRRPMGDEIEPEVLAALCGITVEEAREWCASGVQPASLVNRPKYEPIRGTVRGVDANGDVHLDITHVGGLPFGAGALEFWLPDEHPDDYTPEEWRALPLRRRFEIARAASLPQSPIVLPPERR